MDGKQQIDQAKNTVEQLQVEKKQLTAQVARQQAKLKIEELAEGLPATKRRHLEKVLAGKSAKFITENFEYTLQMFEKGEADKLDNLKQQATKGKKLQDRAPSQKAAVVAESVQEQITQSEPGLQDNGLFNQYMGELGRS